MGGAGGRMKVCRASGQEWEGEVAVWKYAEPEACEGRGDGERSGAGRTSNQNIWTIQA